MRDLRSAVRARLTETSGLSGAGRRISGARPPSPYAVNPSQRPGWSRSRGVSMASSTVRVTSAPDITPATRAQYQRAQCLLPVAWRHIESDHPNAKTSSDAYRLVSTLLSLQPGRVIRQAIRKPDPRKGPGLAERLGWSRQRVFRAVDAARKLSLSCACSTPRPTSCRPNGTRAPSCFGTSFASK